MIFRRSSEPAKTVRKNIPAPAQKQSIESRREPVLAAPRNAPQPGPISPITVAQNRRTQQTNNPAQNFSGKDQLRKLTVGRDISLNGEIGTCDHLIVEGTVTATIKGGKILEITETGTYSGVVDIENADIAGRFDGELIVRGKLIIRPTAVITGVIVYTKLQVDTGATINAQLNVLEAEIFVQPQQQNINHSYTSEAQNQRAFSLASINDEPGFLRANANSY